MGLRPLEAHVVTVDHSFSPPESRRSLTPRRTQPKPANCHRIISSGGMCAFLRSFDRSALTYEPFGDVCASGGPSYKKKKKKKLENICSRAFCSFVSVGKWQMKEKIFLPLCVRGDGDVSIGFLLLLNRERKMHYHDEYC